MTYTYEETQISTVKTILKLCEHLDENEDTKLTKEQFTTIKNYCYGIMDFIEKIKYLRPEVNTNDNQK